MKAWKPSSIGAPESSDNHPGIRTRGDTAPRMFAALIVVMMAASCIVFVGGTDESDAIDDFYCGDNATWLCDGQLLMIGGSGPMWDKTKANEWPWYEDFRTSITTVEIRDEVTHLGDYAFSGLTNLTSVTIGSGVTTIGKYCFANDGKIESLTLPVGLTSIGEGAFKDTAKLTSMVIPDSVISLGSYLFLNSGIEEVTFPASVTAIPNNCFQSCSHLNAFRMPDTVTSIGNQAFMGTNTITYIHFSSALASLGTDIIGKAFYEYGSEYSMAKSVITLKGHTFIDIDGRMTLVSDSLVVDGAAITIAADAGSINVKASDIVYARQSADSDSSTTFSANLSGGVSASFDSSAIQNLAISNAALTVSQIFKDSLDDATKELVGDNPVYDISFGSNTDFGDGKMTVTLPYVLPDGKSADDLRVFCVKDGKVSETIGCSYADGKVTFSTGHLSTYYIGFSSSGGSSDDGGFPLWAIAVIIIVAAVGVFAFLFFQKGGFPPLKGLKMPLPHVGSKSSDGAQTDAPAQEEIRQEPVQEPAPVTCTSVADESASEEKKDE